MKFILGLFLMLESNLSAKTDDIFFFWFGHLVSKNAMIIIQKWSLFVAFEGEKLGKYAKYI